MTGMLSPERRTVTWPIRITVNGSATSIAPTGPTSQLKGGTFKGPFHLPRMQFYCWKLLEAVS